MAIRIAFFGTHEFAATILRGLAESPLFDVCLVVTAPDRPIGRHQQIQPPPVKVLAQAKGIHFDQPESLKNYKFSISNFQLAITAQYGALIPERVLSAPVHGMLNVHTSLLPKYRGASPVQSAILNGDAETGVTIMKMDAGLDTGPILSQQRISIGPDETAEVLEARLAEIAIPMLMRAIPPYLLGQLLPQPQDESLATLCKKLTREDGRIDWSRSAGEIYNRFRAFYPWPGVWSTWKTLRLKFLSMHPGEDLGTPGSVSQKHGALSIACGSGSVSIQRLQLEGKKPMDAQTFIHGHHDFIGSTLS